jgi:hypothetical protein
MAAAANNTIILLLKALNSLVLYFGARMKGEARPQLIDGVSVPARREGHIRRTAYLHSLVQRVA